MVHPSFNVKTNKADIIVKYSLDGTSITADIDKDVQRLAVSQAVGSRNRITPKITSEGRVSLDVSRALDDFGVVTAGLEQECLKLKWQEGATTVTARQPWDGIASLDGLTVRVQRRVEF